MTHQTATYLEQVSVYRLASERLLTALAVRTESHAAHITARDTHDDQRRSFILDGIPNLPERCHAEVREAALCRALEPQLLILRATRERLRVAEAELESAQVQERLERETLRSYQVAAAAQ